MFSLFKNIFIFREISSSQMLSNLWNLAFRMHPLQKFNASSSHQLVVADGCTNPGPVRIFQPVRPGPLRDLVVNQFEKMAF